MKYEVTGQYLKDLSNIENGLYERILKFHRDAYFIRYKNEEINLFPKLIIDQPNIFVLKMKYNCFLKFHNNYNIDTLKTIVKELMEYR